MDSDTLIDRCIKKAQAEILNPTWEMTKQHLKVLTIRYENELPVIERVDHNEDDNYLAVYLPIENELFFLAIIFSIEETIEIINIYIQTGNRIYLTATSETMGFYELSSIFSFKLHIPADADHHFRLIATTDSD